MYFNVYVYKDVILYEKTYKMIEVGIEPTMLSQQILSLPP